MFKPRIFIAIHYLELGGAETSLIGLLHSIKPQQADVDLFVYSHQGPLMHEIPDYVNLLPEIAPWPLFEQPLREVLLRGYVKLFFARIYAKFRMKVYSWIHHPKDMNAVHGYIGKEVSKIMPVINQNVEYDLAISYMNPHDFWLKCVNAKRKICWIHTDYSQIDINVKLEYSTWSAYNNIVSISKDVTTAFLSRFPSLSSKMVYIENMLPEDLIKARSLEVECPYDSVKTEDLILLSVGRICEAKNYDSIPLIARLLIDKKLAFHWYIIGPGDHSNIDLISQAMGVDQYVTFIGPCSNPYPFIKNCSIYVHPSKYEGKSIVVREAQILCRPVIITNYPTAKSQVINGVDGVICDLDNANIADAIYSLANDRQKCKDIEDYLSHHDYSGTNEVAKVLNLANRP